MHCYGLHGCKPLLTILDMSHCYDNSEAATKQNVYIGNVSIYMIQMNVLLQHDECSVFVASVLYMLDIK